MRPKTCVLELEVLESFTRLKPKIVRKAADGWIVLVEHEGVDWEVADIDCGRGSGMLSAANPLS